MNYWSNLGLQIASTLAVDAYSYGKSKLKPHSGKVHYYSPTPPFKTVYTARAVYKATQAAQTAWQNLLSKKSNAKKNAAVKSQIEKLKTKNQRIISNAIPSVADYGRVPIKDGSSEYFYAKDKMGRIVEDSLMIYFDGEETIRTYSSDLSSDSADKSKLYETNRIIFADVTPQVSLSSNKNIVMTQVQGRDYTRKELVSGGDLSFKVSGNIVSPLSVAGYQLTESGESDVVVQYPENEVKKFIEIMQYPGIVNVNHYLFRQFNVNRIIIQDYNLEQATYKNIQPYSFTCVAVEPDEDVIITEDTIYEINDALSTAQTDEEKTWLKALKSQAGSDLISTADDAVKTASTVSINLLATHI